MAFDKKAFDAAVEKRGMKFTAIAGMLGISDTTFRNKRNGATDFSLTEITTLSDVLNLTFAERNRIFFA